jgi:putative hydrolase of the HAD superfamily
MARTMVGASRTSSPSRPLPDVGAGPRPVPIKAVWSDFAGVCTPPLSHTMAVFCRRVGVGQDVLMRAIGKVTASFGTHDFMLPVDTPLITEVEWLRMISDALPPELRESAPRTTIADIWFDGREANHAWIAELFRLRERGLFVGVLSNMMPSWDSYWRKMVPVDELFDDVILSFAVKLRKPQPEIYELATERAQCSPAECLFIDDSAENCEAATAAGWTAIHFTDTNEAIGQVESVLAGRVDSAR